MTLLRRAPREVYRLYGEEEFFAATPPDERIGPLPPGPSGNQLQRLAGATVLLAALGAVGGLIAVTGVASLAGSRRRGSVRLAVATGSVLPTRPDVWRARRSAGVQFARERAMQPAHSARRAGTRARGTVVAPRRRGDRVAITTSGKSASPAPAPLQPGATAMPSGATEMTAGAPVVRRQPVQFEFGFER
jgi:hypothetical protein